MEKTKKVIYKRRMESLGGNEFHLEKPPPANFFAKEKLFYPLNKKGGKGGNQKTKAGDAEYLFESKNVPDEAFLNQYRDSYIKGDIQTGGTGTLKPINEYNNLEILKSLD